MISSFSLKCSEVNMEKLRKSFVPKFTKNNLFEIDFKVLDFVGFNPGRMVNWRSFVIFTLSLLLEVFPECYFIVKHSHDVQAVFMCLHEFVSLLVYVIKVFIFFVSRHSLVSLISDLKKEWNCCKWPRAWLFLSFYWEFFHSCGYETIDLLRSHSGEGGEQQLGRVKASHVFINT